MKGRTAPGLLDFADRDFAADPRRLLSATALRERDSGRLPTVCCPVGWKTETLRTAAQAPTARIDHPAAQPDEPPLPTASQERDSGPLPTVSSVAGLASSPVSSPRRPSMGARSVAAEAWNLVVAGRTGAGPPEKQRQTPICRRSASLPSLDAGNGRGESRGSAAGNHLD